MTVLSRGPPPFAMIVTHETGQGIGASEQHGHNSLIPWLPRPYNRAPIRQISRSWKNERVLVGVILGQTPHANPEDMRAEQAV